jgi:hypothetical protein
VHASQKRLAAPARVQPPAAPGRLKTRGNHAAAGPPIENLDGLALERVGIHDEGAT